MGLTDLAVPQNKSVSTSCNTCKHQN